MFRKVFKKNNVREIKRSECECRVATSTPNMTMLVGGACQCSSVEDHSPDVAIVERSVSAPILVSDASIAELEHSFLQSLGLGDDTTKRCVRLHTPDEADKCASAVQELFFNKDVKSEASVPGNVKQQSTQEESVGLQFCPSLSVTMMFNGLVVCGDSDTSDFTKDSAGASSYCSGACDSDQALYYRNKLHAAQQILQNKEETVRVQCSSLALAEARIAALATRANMLTRQLDDKTQELQRLQNIVNGVKIEKADVSITADAEDAKVHKNVVTTLQNNLSIIEELYRECFYETAKQEELIDILRKSYLDVRLMDKEKSEHIGRLQSVINTQKWSLEQCQDMAIEVDNLKSEISNFLNNSNNDSGVWEPSGAGAEVGEELHDIMLQLTQLRDILAGDCTCGLEEENMRLKERNETMEIQLGELRQKVYELETTLQAKDNTDTDFNQQIEMKEKELQNIREQLALLEEGTRDQSTACDTLTLQLHQVQVLLRDKTEELSRVQQQCDAHELTIKDLKEELNRADKIIKENCKIRSEVSYLSGQVSLWRAQLTDSELRMRTLDQELRRAREHCTHVDECFREKASCAAALECQVQEAHRRGAELCAEAAGVVAAVRRWLQRMRHRHREQEDKIKDQEIQMRKLQRRLQERQSDTLPMSASENEPCCSRYLSTLTELRAATDSCSKCSKAKERSTEFSHTSGSERASCSSAPVPPRRLLRKNIPACRIREAGVQHPTGRPRATSPAPRSSRDACCAAPVSSRDACCDAPVSSRDACCPGSVSHRVQCCTTYRRPRDAHVHPVPRELSPSEELFSRVEQLSAALADGQRRWSRPRLTHTR